MISEADPHKIAEFIAKREQKNREREARRMDNKQKELDNAREAREVARKQREAIKLKKMPRVIVKSGVKYYRFDLVILRH